MYFEQFIIIILLLLLLLLFKKCTNVKVWQDENNFEYFVFFIVRERFCFKNRNKERKKYKSLTNGA
jgi:hypothetical protein